MEGPTHLAKPQNTSVSGLLISVTVSDVVATRDKRDPGDIREFPFGIAGVVIQSESESLTISPLFFKD